MKDEELLQNVIAIAERAQKAGLFSLQEIPAILQTIQQITEVLTPKEVEKAKK